MNYRKASLRRCFSFIQNSADIRQRAIGNRLKFSSLFLRTDRGKSPTDETAGLLFLSILYQNESSKTITCKEMHATNGCSNIKNPNLS